jgi:hypothetical protein
MVKGQMRVLGSKQHLKSKFGSGYELVIKCANVNDIKRMSIQKEQIDKFVVQLFPRCVLLNDNGKLVDPN